MPGQTFLLLHMHELLTFLNHRAVTTMLIVGQHGSLGEVRTEIDLSYLADATMMFRFFEAEGAVRSAVTVVKSRTAPNERTIREFRLSQQRGLQIGEPIADFEGVMSGMPRYAGVDQDDGRQQRMSVVPAPAVEQRVLVHAPRGRDAQVVSQVLHAQAMQPEVCDSLELLTEALQARRGHRLRHRGVARRAGAASRWPTGSRTSRPGRTSRSSCWSRAASAVGRARRAARSPSSATSSCSSGRSTPTRW